MRFLITLLGSVITFHSSAIWANGERSLQEIFAEVDDGPVIVVAHRGCWTAAPENSIASVNACKKLGVEAIEIDVQLTKDKKLIVLHDKTVDRMTNGSGRVSEMTLDQVKVLKLKERDGSGNDLVKRAFLTSEKIPTLKELLEAVGTDLLINLEIKRNKGWEFSEVFDAAVAEVKASGLETQVFWKIPAPSRGGGPEEVTADKMYNALNTSSLTQVTPIIWKSGRSFLQQLDDFADDGIMAFEIVADDLSHWPLGADGKIVGSDKYRYMGVAVLPRWSGGLSDEVALERPDDAWGKLIELGFDMLMTDRPEQLVEYLKSKNYR